VDNFRDIAGGTHKSQPHATWALLAVPRLHARQKSGLFRLLGRFKTTVATKLLYLSLCLMLGVLVNPGGGGGGGGSGRPRASPRLNCPRWGVPGVITCAPVNPRWGITSPRWGITSELYFTYTYFLTMTHFCLWCTIRWNKRL
jgi:hypothetical protein